MMDYAMPVCAGVEATRYIRKFISEFAPELKQPFVCCLTSYNNLSYKIEAHNVGMDAYLTKPIFKSGINRLLIKSGLIGK